MIEIFQILLTESFWAASLRIATPLIFGVLGFTIQGGFVGLYSVAARIYPTEFRTTGVGWGIGAGRLGAVLGPLVAGILIGTGISISMNFIIFAIPALIAALVTYMISIAD